ncbi:hypothetical protein ALC56_00554, partial [Trachymyrmex septentrionalis]
LFTALATPAALPTNNSRMPNNGRISRTPPRFAIGSIHLLFFFFFQAHYSFWSCCPNCCGCSSLSESRITCGNAFPSLFHEYSAARRSARSLLCEYAISCSQHAASNELIP